MPPEEEQHQHPTHPAQPWSPGGVSRLHPDDLRKPGFLRQDPVPKLDSLPLGEGSLYCPFTSPARLVITVTASILSSIAKLMPRKRVVRESTLPTASVYQRRGS
jgi:hypothetical protein